MCGGIHYGEVERLVSVERWSCSRGASCVCLCSVVLQYTQSVSTMLLVSAMNVQ